MNYEEFNKGCFEEAKRLYKTANANQRCVLEKLFPELAESEDEKIRKALLEMVHDTTGDELWIDYNVHKEEALDWLEKQKEYESTDFEYVWDITDCGELTSALDKYSEEAIINMCHAWYDKGIELERKSWLEKQNEQKPTDSYCQENCKGFQETGKCFADGECKAKREAEQKSVTWNEEDEQHIDSLLKRLDSLCINKFERTRFAISEDRDWLKSLRPQNQWKPSNEQMEALNWHIGNTSVGSWQYKATKELIADLKKLKGEV